jgi:hypothetical protein
MISTLFSTMMNGGNMNISTNAAHMINNNSIASVDSIWQLNKNLSSYFVR